jgi:hypothetical protein
MFGVDPGLLSRQYKLHLSDFLDWKEEKYNSESLLSAKIRILFLTSFSWLLSHVFFAIIAAQI